MSGSDATAEDVHSLPARWAVALSAVAAVTVAVATFGAAYALDGAHATEDNWLALLIAVSLFFGVLASLTAFALAIAPRIRHEQWRLLWLPLSVLPVLPTFPVLGEPFWWE